MTASFAHSEYSDKPTIRYLRRAVQSAPCYQKIMKLRIKDLRKAKGWTVSHLANLVNMSPSYVSEIENGKKQANGRRLTAFADALGISVYELIDDDSLDAELVDHLKIMADLPEEDRKSVIRHALGLLAEGKPETGNRSE